MTSKKQQQKRQARRLQLDIDEDVKKILKDMSDEWGVSQSQIVQFFLLTGDINQISQYLEPSDAPMWKYRINFDQLKRDLGID